MRGRVLLGGLFASWLTSLLAGCVQDRLVHEPDPFAPSQRPSNLLTQAPLPPDMPGEPGGSPYRAQTINPEAHPSPGPENPGPTIPVVAPAPTSAETQEPIPDPVIIVGHAAVPAAPESCVMEALRALQARRPEAEIRGLLSRLDQPSQDLLLRLLTLTNRLGERGVAEGLNPQDMGMFLQQVEEISASLRTRAALLLPRVCFCRKIETFGVFDPLPNPVFQAGVGMNPGERVQLYVEVRNFGRRECGRHYFETALASKLEIHPWRLLRTQTEDAPGEIAAQGQSVPGKARDLYAKMDFPTRYERSLTPRQDYFISFQFHIPPNLSPGHYTLSVEVRDDIGVDPATGKGRTAHSTVDFEVVGPVPRREPPTTSPGS
jgi:hypothetical protein